MFEHKPFKKQLSGHNDEITAYIVPDYPYGYTMRTTIRYWIETTKNGQRAVSQTKNPKNGIWNKPKKGTYSDIMVMGLDDQDHVSFDGLSMGNGEDEVLSFEKCFILDEYQKKRLLLIHGMARGQKFVTYTCRVMQPGDIRQSEEEQREITKKASLAGLSEVLHEKSLSVSDVV